MVRTKNPAGATAPSTSKGPSKSKSKRARQSSPEADYNTNIFTSKAAEDRYDKISSRSVIPERGFNVSSNTEIGVSIRNSILGHEWVKYCAVPEFETNLNFVYEFYANLPDHNGDVVTVRGKKVDVSIEAINDLLGTPDVPFENEGYREWLRTCSHEEMARLLCIPGEDWVLEKGKRVLKRDQLTRIAKAWIYFVCARLYPIKHFTTLDEGRIQVLFCIIKGHSINVGRFIYNWMKSLDYTNERHGLPYPSIITGLCTNAGVGRSKRDTIKGPMGPITNNIIDRYKIREEPQEEEAEDEEEEGEEGPPVNEPRLFLPAPPVVDPATIDYIAQCSNYLVGGFQHTQQYMHQQAEYGASHINQLNDLYSRWDINQENQVLFPPYPQYSDYLYPPPQWPPHMAPPQYPAHSPPPPPPNDD